MAIPETSINSRFSSPGATAREWAEAEALLDTAQLFSIVTVRRDGRPHATSLLAVWVDDALFITTGPDEQKAKNLQHNANVLLLHGNGSFTDGLDLVVEGTAVREQDPATLQRIADRYGEKYGAEWRFTVVEGGFSHANAEMTGAVHVYRIAPEKVLGFHNGEPYSQTRWTFSK